MKSRNLIKLLEEDGWKLKRINGSHHIFKHPVKQGTPSVPHPKQGLPKGTVRNILKEAELL